MPDLKETVEKEKEWRNKFADANQNLGVSQAFRLGEISNIECVYSPSAVASLFHCLHLQAFEVDRVGRSNVVARIEIGVAYESTSVQVMNLYEVRCLHVNAMMPVKSTIWIYKCSTSNGHALLSFHSVWINIVFRLLMEWHKGGLHMHGVSSRGYSGGKRDILEGKVPEHTGVSRAQLEVEKKRCRYSDSNRGLLGAENHNEMI